MNSGTSGKSLRPKRVLAVSSGGGHWEQMMLLSAAFEGCKTTYATTIPGLLQRSNIEDGHVLSDCNQDQFFASLKCLGECIKLVFKTRPDVVISTGAAPGFLCLIAGRLVGAKTIWIDSVANVEKMSMSGKMAKYVASLWLTQWKHLSKPGGPTYVGEVL